MLNWWYLTHEPIRGQGVALRILKPGSLRPSHCSCLAEHLQKDHHFLGSSLWFLSRKMGHGTSHSKQQLRCCEMPGTREDAG